MEWDRCTHSVSLIYPDPPHPTMAPEATAIALALGAMLCLGTSDFLNKRAMRARVPRTEFLVVQSVFFIATTVVLLPSLGGLDWSPYLALAAVCGLVTFGSYFCVLRALSGGDATIITPVYRMGFAWTVALAVVFLGEEVTGRKVLGLLLVVAALLLLTATNARNGGRQAAACSAEGMPVCDTDRDVTGRTRLGVPVAFAVLALVLIGTKAFLYKVGANEGADAAPFALVQALAFLPAAAAAARVQDGAVRASRLTMRHAPLNGVLTALASVLLFLALERGEAIIAVPISQLCFVVTAVLAIALFRERMTAAKALGVLAAVGAVLVLGSALPLPFGL
jgi:transporter family protein